MTKKDKEINELRREVAFFRASLERHGHWIKPNSRPSSTQAKCSICGRVAYNNLLKTSYVYCPWCGARMDEISQQED